MTRYRLTLRRSLPIALAASACAVLISACSGSSAPAAVGGTHSFKGQELTVFANGPEGTYVRQYNDYYSALGAAFHKATGATLKMEYFTTPSQEISTIETAAVSGSGPDVIGYGTALVGTLTATGDFSSLTSQNWNVVGGKQAFFPAALADAGTTPADTIGIPYCTFPYVLAYNTKDFQAAGIKTPPTTWSDFVADAQKIQKAVPGVYGAGIDPDDSFDPWKNIWLYTHALGGHFVSPDNESTALASSQVEAAVSFYFSLYYKYHVVPQQALTWNNAEMGSAFTSGKIAMFPVASQTMAEAAQGTPVAAHLAFAPLPVMPYGLTKLPPGGRAAETMTTGGYWAIPRYAQAKTPLAMEFARVSTTPAMQVTAYKLLGYMPVTYAGIKAVEQADPASKPFIQAAVGAQRTSVSPVWSYVETGLGTAVNNIGSHVATTGSWSASYAEEQLRTAQAAANVHM
jgi:multiple sugar transport system substrate-binding protein